MGVYKVRVIGAQDPNGRMCGVSIVQVTWGGGDFAESI